MVNSLAQKHFIAYNRNQSEFTIDSSREGFVYIFRVSGTNRLKIGHSKNPERRLSSLTSPQMPFNLEFVYKEWFIDAYALEQHIHKIFSKFRVKGEWFEIPLEVTMSDPHPDIAHRNIVVADKWSYSRSAWHAKNNPDESILIRIGLDDFLDSTIQPIIKECVEKIAVICGLPETSKFINPLSETLCHSIMTGIVSPWCYKNIERSFSQKEKMVLRDLNTLIAMGVDAIELDMDTGFGGENLDPEVFLCYAIGKLTGIIHSSCVCYDTIEDVYKELNANKQNTLQ